MKKYFLLLLIFIIAASGMYLLNQRQSTHTEKTGKLEVNTSFYPLYFFASQIGGDKASVHNITPAGSEPHDYEPTTQDIVSIEKSAVLVLNGGVEAWGTKMKDNLNGTDVLIVTAGDSLLTKNITEEGQTGVDPHV